MQTKSLSGARVARLVLPMQTVEHVLLHCHHIAANGGSGGLCMGSPDFSPVFGRLR